ncbi:HesA/MoeB/ThiF family protein [Catelliglobosispora koreensis]|uniref:HesA/MoeB/ThiF family protein n=1 Tax=Catelliglobosispora koreensis TaxID=129052 RepID=UPI000378E489|nr:ThiF family adenylyltransferase [Catelliglobosispora koreensis]
MNRPRIKGNHRPLRLTPTLISVGGQQYGIGARIDDDEEGTIWRLMSLMDGRRSRDEIVAELTGERPELDAESLHEAISSIVDAGHVEDAGAPRPASLSAEEEERYDRALNYFAWVDLTPRPSRFELQARLKAARVTVCGLGGTGSAVASSLVAAGAGSVRCVDFDRVEVGNLTRQLLYTEDDLGASKVQTAVARLRRMNRHVQVTGIERKLTCTADAAELMRETDLFVLCADQPMAEIRQWVNEAALATGTPWQVSQYAGPMAVTGIFVPGQTCCYACLLTVNDAIARDWGQVPGLFESRGGHAVLGPTANLTGHLSAMEAIYFLVGLRPTSLGRVFHQSLTDLTYHYLVAPDPDSTCAVCGRT